MDLLCWQQDTHSHAKPPPVSNSNTIWSKALSFTALPQSSTFHPTLDILGFYPFLGDRISSLLSAFLFQALSSSHFVTSFSPPWDKTARHFHGVLLSLSQEIFKWASTRVPSFCLLTTSHSLAFRLLAFCLQRWSCGRASCRCHVPTPPRSSPLQGFAGTVSPAGSGPCPLNSLETTAFLASWLQFHFSAA